MIACASRCTGLKAATNTLFFDHNPGAIANEGLGDNVIIGPCGPMEILFRTYSDLESIYGPDAGEISAYRMRIWGHRLLGSRVFASGINAAVIGRSELRWHLHRERLDILAIGARRTRNGIDETEEQIIRITECHPNRQQAVTCGAIRRRTCA